MALQSVLLLITIAASTTMVNGAGFLQADLVSEQDARKMFEAEMMDIDPAVLAKWKDELRPIHGVLQKNEHGNLGPNGVRFILHRYFMQKYGWHIRGLVQAENPKDGSDDGSDDAHAWIPSYLQGLLDKHKHSDHGSSLRDISILAATIEDLTKINTRGRLKEAFTIHDVSFEKGGTFDEIMVPLRSYFQYYLGKHHFSFKDAKQAMRFQDKVVAEYNGWSNAAQLLKQVVEQTGLELEAGNDIVGFDQVVKTADELGRQYWKLNERECTKLRTTLLDMEGHKPGRVRLSHFYQTGLHGHWKFTEKTDYLRAIGALDESQDFQQVIVQNYVLARVNCFKATQVYSVCCKNPCEDLMSELEIKVSGSQATPAQIAEMVSKQRSDLLSVPANLSSELWARLDQVAATNDGTIPLHGRLFAQWMHHVYPRDCPYPHESGATTPHTPDEWLASTFDEMVASLEERKKLINDDTCPMPIGDNPLPSGCAGNSDLPWQQVEKLPHADFPEAPVPSDNFLPIVSKTVLSVIFFGTLLAFSTMDAHKVRNLIVQKRALAILLVNLAVCCLLFVNVRSWFQSIWQQFDLASFTIALMLGTFVMTVKFFLTTWTAHLAGDWDDFRNADSSFYKAV